MISYFCSLLLGKVHTFVNLQMRRSFFHKEFPRQKNLHTNVSNFGQWNIIYFELCLWGQLERMTVKVMSGPNVESICSVGRAVISILRLRTSFPPLCQNNVSLPPPLLSKLLTPALRQATQLPFRAKTLRIQGRREGRGGEVPILRFCCRKSGSGRSCVAARETRGRGCGCCHSHSCACVLAPKYAEGSTTYLNKTRIALNSRNWWPRVEGWGGWIFSMVLWLIWKPYQGLWCQWPRKCAVVEGGGGGKE